MILDILPSDRPERPYRIEPDRSHWPPGPDWCPSGEGVYYPDLRLFGMDLVMPHASIKVYGRRWGIGRKIIYRVCPSCDYREFEPTKRKAGAQYGRI